MTTKWNSRHFLSHKINEVHDIIKKIYNGKLNSNWSDTNNASKNAIRCLNYNTLH
jgi:hypothetical protein